MIKIFERYKDHLTRILLAFVIFSVGYAFGKHSVKATNSDSGQMPSQIQNTSPAGENFVRLYYMHAMFRCVTCNSIEAQARKLTETEFSAELADKKIVWEEVNFQQNQQLATKFDVVSSCIVVAVEKNGHIESFERLDQVWTLLEKPDEFNAYIRTAIKKALSNI